MHSWGHPSSCGRWAGSRKHDRNIMMWLQDHDSWCWEREHWQPESDYSAQVYASNDLSYHWEWISALKRRVKERNREKRKVQKNEWYLYITYVIKLGSGSEPQAVFGSHGRRPQARSRLRVHWQVQVLFFVHLRWGSFNFELSWYSCWPVPSRWQRIPVREFTTAASLTRRTHSNRSDSFHVCLEARTDRELEQWQVLWKRGQHLDMNK